MNRRTLGVEPAAMEFKAVGLLESLAESRISILFLARQATEAKEKVLAKELREKGQALRTEIARVRRAALAEWNQETKTHAAKAKVAQARLAKLVLQAEQGSKKSMILTRALGLASTLLGLTGKVL